jgi:hypothetical protein
VRAAFEAGDNTKDDEEVVARNTLGCGLEWAHCAFDELILPLTSVSSPPRAGCFFLISRFF